MLFNKRSMEYSGNYIRRASKVKIFTLQILSSKFEALKMAEDEIIAEFNLRVLDLKNESFALGKKQTDTKLFRKVLRSFPSCFNMNVTAIKEANGITTMKLDELFGSLRTFKLSLEDNLIKKKNSVAFLGNK